MKRRDTLGLAAGLAAAPVLPIAQAAQTAQAAQATSVSSARDGGKTLHLAFPSPETTFDPPDRKSVV